MDKFKEEFKDVFEDLSEKGVLVDEKYLGNRISAQ